MQELVVLEGKLSVRVAGKERRRTLQVPLQLPLLKLLLRLLVLLLLPPRRLLLLWLLLLCDKAVFPLLNCETGLLSLHAVALAELALEDPVEVVIILVVTFNLWASSNASRSVSLLSSRCSDFTERVGLLEVASSVDAMVSH